MRGIILLNGEPYHGIVDRSDAYVVCCDGALVWARERGIACDLVLGDFDSLGYIPEEGERYPVEKDMTDGELALTKLMEMGVSSIDIYGGGGKREDHFFGNVGLMIKAEQGGIKAAFHTDYTDFFLADGEVEIREKAGTYVSVVPVTRSVHIHDSEGMKYSMNGLVINLGESRGISNETVSPFARFYIESGKALVFIVRKS